MSAMKSRLLGWLLMALFAGAVLVHFYATIVRAYRVQVQCAHWNEQRVGPR